MADDQGNLSQVYDASTDSYTDAWDILSPIPAGSTSFMETVTIHSEYESDLDPWNLGDYTCDDGSILGNGWVLINDGNTDCADGSDEGFDYAEEIKVESLSLHDKELELIKKSLEKHKGRRKLAAKELGISERTLYRKIKQFNL